MGKFFFISETYQLSSIFKLCSTKADIFVQPGADVEHISNDAVAELLLCNLEARHQKSTFSEKKNCSLKMSFLWIPMCSTIF